MGSVTAEFELELARLRARFPADPRAELLRLFLIALEREELVSVGYRESLMVERLNQMPLPDGVRELVRHALIWIWKDEEMHSIYIRGAILRLGNARLRTQALLTQAAGGLGGWASSVLQHSRWRRAPLSRLAASAIAAGGKLLGKVPKEVRHHLKYGPFRDFCLFNVEAEQTAAICWRRIAQLAAGQSEFDERLLGDFRRVAEDEDRHERIFRVMAEALDDQDRLADGFSAQLLAERIGEVGEAFLPRSFRGISAAENPLGSGGRVWSLRGNSIDEKLGLFGRLLRESDLRECIAVRAARLGKPVGQMRVVVKPTFMLGYSRRDRSPITDPSLLAELCRFLREEVACADVAVLEGPNIYDRFFHHRSVESVAEYFGIRSPHFRVVDASRDQVAHAYRRGMAQYTVARTWKEADFRISFPKLRSHPIELALLAIGNAEWVGGRCDEFLFIERQASRATAVMMLLDEFPPHFAMIDGYEDAPDGLVGVMGCARPRRPLRFYAGADALAVDMLAARHLGIADPRESSLLQAAFHWFGGWSRQVEVIGCDEPIRDWRGPYSNELWALLSLLAWPVYMMGSGRGRLFVPEMDAQAFPSIDREGLLLRLARQAVRRLLGLKLRPHH
ncbi:MAG: DUF362 domain-containing protein [Pirellulales bacterium]